MTSISFKTLAACMQLWAPSRSTGPSVKAVHAEAACNGNRISRAACVSVGATANGVEGFTVVGFGVVTVAAAGSGVAGWSEMGVALGVELLAGVAAGVTGL
eukprot:CAMPEP_0174352154 /NCGR_PEP_ID=MMETSP0811_2-20130205/9717_1 /TAXON_ID=73025 ORGANISM="Eutreptiella gymnastica-like, Strain CCMP1594" /NCGR_SAMPLE_ID=MMETSP0811_2 /ASSEMBLY_ACC=CAM_ASM_000667 /LENGTH=100 /DNA_ID=CAMNT_0015482065 /DNA_START=797 /DNA_END=1099 /DNA_ORIENTATION=+